VGRQQKRGDDQQHTRADHPGEAAEGAREVDQLADRRRTGAPARWWSS
jgi:hypothetical protein